MEVTINIDSLRGNIEQVFESLSSEEKKELAKEVMLKVLTEALAGERLAYENILADRLYEAAKKDSYSHVNSLDEVRQSYKFRDGMQKFKSSSERMLETITREATENFKAQVTDLVKNDPQLQQVMAVVREQFIADFPTLVQATMATYFASQMNQISQALMQVNSVSDNVRILGCTIQAQLATQGININPPSV